MFELFKEIEIERPSKFGGNATFTDYAELEKAFTEGKLHPMDLKKAVAKYVDKAVEPTRKHFEKNPKARKLFEFVQLQQVTR